MEHSIYVFVHLTLTDNIYQGNIKDKNVEKGGRELSEGGVREYTLGELLPDSFGLEQMEVPRTVRR